jgi:Cation efflux family/Dimerisation domain of Zinc Transporter
VLVVNIAFTAWEHYQAEHLDSDLLRADAGHTLSDVAVTLVVIAGWQLAAMGYAWVDTVFAVGVALFVFYLAFSLFKRSVPVLVDHYVVDPDELRAIVRPVVGVTTVTRVRSHQAGSTKSIEVVASVAADLTTTQSHAIADAISRRPCKNATQTRRSASTSSPRRNSPVSGRSIDAPCIRWPIQKNSLFHALRHHQTPALGTPIGPKASLSSDLDQYLVSASTTLNDTVGELSRPAQNL